MSKFIKKYNNFIILFCIFMIVIIFSTILFSFNKKKEFFSNNKLSIEYFYMPQCSHCVQFSKEWDKIIKNAANNDKLKDVSFDKYDILEGAGIERGNKFNITGTPTILAIKNDKIVDEFKGQRNLNDIINFAIKNNI